MQKSLILWAVLVLSGLAGWWAVRRTAPVEAVGGRPGGGRAVPVETMPVRRATVSDTGRFSGTLEPRSIFSVAPRVAGRLERLLVDIGDSVTNGQLIAVIDDQEYAQQLEQARAERDVARANLVESVSALEIAQRDLDRIQSLHQQRVASDAEHDAARARYDAAAARRTVAEAQLAQREAGLASAQIRLAYTRIHAAWDDGNGNASRVIGERHVHEGALLSVGQPIVSILDIDHLTAVVYVIERDYPKVQVGQPVQVTAEPWPDEQFDGVVARVAPLVREMSRQARVEIDVPNPDRRLRPGMFVRAGIVFGVFEDVCVLPVAAVVRRGGQAGVFHVNPDGETVRFVPVTMGVTDRGSVQILDPPLSGEVVTLGGHLLNDGSAIRIAGP